MFRAFSKYLFATLVFVYVLTVVGLPVYLHYCGGEVEEISYLVESNGCCGEEVPEDGCCRNEGLVIANKVDFTLKAFSADLIKSVTEIFYLPPRQTLLVDYNTCRYFIHKDLAPPWQHSELPAITVLRI